MELQDFKRWHWMALGLVLGLALGGMRAFWGPDYRNSTARTLSQDLFERALLQYRSPSLTLSDLVLHPADEDGVSWVTGRFSEEKSYAGPNGDNAGPPTRVRVAGQFKYRADAEYRPKLWLQGMPHEPTTIRTYLNTVVAQMPRGQVSYHYAWHEQRGMTLGLWTAGTLVVVGGLWPTLLHILIGAGLGPKRKKPEENPEIRHSDPIPAPEKQPAKTPPNVEEQEKVVALAAEMEKHLAASAPTTPVFAPEPAGIAAPVRQLSAGPIEAAPEDIKSGKQYAGEYYPTETHAPRKDHPGGQSLSD